MAWTAISLGILLWSIAGCNALSVYDSPHVAPGQLHIYPWQIFPDMVVLDWYIKLKDKDRMVGCDLSYGPEAGGNTSTVDNFLPLYRTIKIHSLTSSTEYWVYLVCRDIQGGIHASHTVNFTTGEATLSEPQLAAVQVETVVQTERLNSGMLSSRPSKAVSPHVVMGISCVILSMVVLMVSSVIVVKKYQASGDIMETQFEHEGVVTEGAATTSDVSCKGHDTWQNIIDNISEDREHQDLTLVLK